MRALPAAAQLMAGRLVVMAHFDYEGEVAPHARRHIEAWNGMADRLIVVSTASLTEESRAWLSDRVELIERHNYGYDFVSYQVGLAQAGDLAEYDEVVICNDSFVGPLRPYRRIFADMDDVQVDFWGFTSSNRNAPHVQSFFVVFRSWVVRSQAFSRFWSEMTPLPDRKQVIHRYEVGMSTGLVAAGFVGGSYFKETPEDEVVARRRVRWWAVHRPPGLRRGLRNGLFQTRAAEWWNPGSALADRALDDGRLPFVKIDTLRYDPHALDADGLLRRCENAYPDQFEGVRAYLERTASHYPRRAQEELLSTPWMLRPVSRLVEYGR